MTQYLILGSGIAGRRAAEAIRERDASGEIVMIDEQPKPFYARPMLAEMLAKGQGADKIPAKEHNRLVESGIKLQTGTKIKELRAHDQKVLLGDGRLLPYDKLLIASGRKAAKLACDDGETTGVVYFDRLAEAEQINAAVKSVRRAVVYGASYQAMGVLSGLSQRGVACTLVLPEERLLPGALDAVAADILEERLRREGIEVLKSAPIHMIEKAQSALAAVVAGSGNKIAADLLVVTAPQAPLVDYLRQSDLAAAQGVEADNRLRSSFENIFVAGDVARLPIDTLPDTMLQTGWLRAWKQGQIAGANMAGASLSYDGIPTVRTKVLDLDLVCLGRSAATGEGVRYETGKYPREELPYIYKKLVYANDKVVGAIFVGDVTEAGTVEQWISKGMTAKDCDRRVIDQMFNPHFGPAAAHGVLCPVCKFQMQIDSQAKEGTVITCPACGLDFRIQRLPNGAFCALPA